MVLSRICKDYQQFQICSVWIAKSKPTSWIWQSGMSEIDNLYAKFGIAERLQDCDFAEMRYRRVIVLKFAVARAKF